MIVSCNNTIKEIHYNGHIIQKVYGCSGELVYEATPPITAYKVAYTLYDVQHTIPCNSSSTITYNEIRNDLTDAQEASAITSVVIGDCVTSIEQNTFYDYKNLSSITISSAVTSIGQSAFSNCRRLPSIDIPSGVTTIETNTFASCYSLTSINLHNGITNIGNNAFNNCTGLTTCRIGSGVTTIGYSAFNNCTSLASITVNATTPPTLGSNAFKYTNNCPIYVPSESVETYKTTSGWSTYASRIQAIP